MRLRSPRPRSISHERQGIALLATVVLLMVVGLVVAALLRQTLQTRSQQKLAENEIQAAYLLDSGRELAWSRLRENPGYKGETWSIPASRLAGKGDARITIRLEPSPDPDNLDEALTIFVTAEFPLDQTHQVRRSGQFKSPRTTTTTETSQPTGDPRP